MTHQQITELEVAETRVTATWDFRYTKKLVSLELDIAGALGRVVLIQ